MLVVRLELHSARTGKVTEIGRMLIDNTSRNGNDHPRGDYRVRLMRRERVGQHAWRKVTREGEVKNYPRLSYSVWRLVLRSLKSVLHEEK